MINPNFDFSEHTKSFMDALEVYVTRVADHADPNELAQRKQDVGSRLDSLAKEISTRTRKMSIGNTSA